MPDLLTSVPAHRYEAVCGYDLDGEAAVWGSGDTPEDDSGDARIVSHSGEQTITLTIGIDRVEGAV